MLCDRQCEVRESHRMKWNYQEKNIHNFILTTCFAFRKKGKYHKIDQHDSVSDILSQLSHLVFILFLWEKHFHSFNHSFHSFQPCRYSSFSPLVLHYLIIIPLKLQHPKVHVLIVLRYGPITVEKSGNTTSCDLECILLLLRLAVGEVFKAAAS